MQLQARHREAAKATEPEGFFHLMRRHVAMYYPRSTRRLVVTFDNMMSIVAPWPHYPWAFGFVEQMGASHLGIMIAGLNDWFRHVDLWDFFDLLREVAPLQDDQFRIQELFFLKKDRPEEDD